MNSTYLMTPGGAGTYAINDFVTKYKGVNYIKGKERQNNPYSRNPEFQLTWKHKYNGKVVFIYSNPYDTILSFYRRKFFNSIYHCKHIEGDVEYQKNHLNLTLEQFLKDKYDFYKLKEHFFNWFNYSEGYYNIMFLKYEAINKHKIELFNWFNIDKEISNTFIFKPRNSNYETQPTHIKTLLQNMYGELFEFQNKLNDLIIYKK